MAHVGLKDRQQRADVLAARKPRTQVVDRESMAQVVHTRAVASAPVGDAGLPQKSAEILVEVPEGQRLPVVPGKNHSPPVRPTTWAW